MPTDTPESRVEPEPIELDGKRYIHDGREWRDSIRGLIVTKASHFPAQAALKRITDLQNTIDQAVELLEDGDDNTDLLYRVEKIRQENRDLQRQVKEWIGYHSQLEKLHQGLWDDYKYENMERAAEVLMGELGMLAEDFPEIESCLPDIIGLFEDATTGARKLDSVTTEGSNGTR